ncbi:MAG: hypothetical protein VW333_03930, partial [Pseudomonadales bacterium]
VANRRLKFGNLGFKPSAYFGLIDAFHVVISYDLDLGFSSRLLAAYPTADSAHVTRGGVLLVFARAGVQFGAMR